MHVSPFNPHRNPRRAVLLLLHRLRNRSLKIQSLVCLWSQLENRMLSSEIVGILSSEFIYYKPWENAL